MMRKVLSLLSIGLLTLTFFVSPVCADEAQPEERFSLGNRALPLEERLAERKATDEQEKEIEEKQAAFKNAKCFFGTSPMIHSGTFHSATFISAMGDAIELEDGSIWLVRAKDIYKVLGWLSMSNNYYSDLLVISPNHSWFSNYDYVITNQQTNEAIAVNLSVAPFCRGPYSHWIVGIDLYSNYVYLEDGTVWSMSSSNISRWAIGDGLIIGINDGYFTRSYPNVLINVETLDCISGCCAH